MLHSNNNDHTWREIDILQETLSKKKQTLISEKAQSEKMQLEFTLLREWMDVIIANLLQHLRRYQVDDRIQAIHDRFTAAVGDHDGASKPKELVAMLEQHIQIMLDIVDDIESKSFAIKQKEIGGVLGAASGAKMGAINENEAMGVGADSNAMAATKKKKTRGKHAK